MSKRPLAYSEVFRRIVLSITLVVGVLYIYVIITGATVSIFDPWAILYSIVLIYLGWVISALRLYYILRAVYHVDKRVLFSCLNARFLGDVFAKITPSSLGGEPARAYYISISTSTSFMENYALTIYEVYHDVVFTCTLGTIISVFFLPLSIPVLATSIVTLLLWITLFNNIRSAFIDNIVNFIQSKLGRFKAIDRIIEQFNEFRKCYINVSSKTRIIDKVTIWLLTLAINIVWALSITPLITKASTLTWVLYRSIAAYSMMQAISILPTPGGSGVAEYGLTIVLEPDVVVTYRLIYYFTPMVYGLTVLLYLLLRRGTR